MKDHRHVAIGGHDIADVLAIDQHCSRAELLEAGDRTQRGRLPAARGADEHHQLAIVDREVDSA
ncbi:MAG TPA: hypothetical protein VHF88_05240 [Thermoleophilaceae bacterium]|nr:hypothetical protein [Thermoleophilaceae bacterium]